MGVIVVVNELLPRVNHAERDEQVESVDKKMKKAPRPVGGSLLFRWNHLISEAEIDGLLRCHELVE